MAVFGDDLRNGPVAALQRHADGCVVDQTRAQDDQGFSDVRHGLDRARRGIDDDDRLFREFDAGRARVSVVTGVEMREIADPQIGRDLNT